MPSRPAGAHARKPAAKWTADDRALMRADKVLRRVMEEQGPIHPEIDRRGSRPDPWEALARAIVGQQLSTRAAASIWNKTTTHQAASIWNSHQAASIWNRIGR